MKKYLRILLMFAKTSLMEQMAYRTSFILAVIGKIFWLGVFIIFLKAIYLQVPEISGWNFYESIFLFAIFQFITNAADILFYRSISDNLSWYIQRGNFDLILVKPINKLFYSTFETIDLMDGVSMLPILILIGYLIPRLSVQFHLLNIVLGIILLFFALIFIYSWFVIIGTTYFWVISGRGLTQAADNMIDLARWPTDIYQGNARILFNFVFPIFIIATLPAKTILGNIDFPMIVYAFIITIIFFVIAIKFWNFGLKHYASASS